MSQIWSRVRGRSGQADVQRALQAVRRGDEEAFRVLYRDLQPRLVRYLHALVADDANTVAEQAWLQITQDLVSFRGDYDRLRGRAAAIAREWAIDHLNRMPLQPGSASDTVAVPETAVDVLADRSTDQAIALVTALPRCQAETVLLRTVMGLDAKQAGRVLGITTPLARTASELGLHTLAQHAARPTPSP